MENTSSSVQGIGQQVLPNSTGALVLGIISIVTVCCYGIVGLACGIIAIVLANKAKKLYKDNTNLYTISSYNNAHAGKICGIIGVSLSGLILVFYLIYFLIIGSLLGGAIHELPFDKIFDF